MAVRLNWILKKETHQNDIFTSKLIRLYNLATKDSQLLPLFYSLTTDGEIIVLDEPLTYLQN